MGRKKTETPGGETPPRKTRAQLRDAMKAERRRRLLKALTDHVPGGMVWSDVYKNVFRGSLKKPALNAFLAELVRARVVTLVRGKKTYQVTKNVLYVRATTRGLAEAHGEEYGGRP